jgi:hypothetical protein
MKLPPLLLALMLAAAPCFAQGSDESKSDSAAGSKYSWSLESDVTSRYDWRGLALSQGAVVQTTLTASSGPISFYLWNNYMANKGYFGGQFSELDYTLTYAEDLKNGVTFTPMLNVYTYPYNAYPFSVELGGQFSKSFGKYSLETSHYVFVKEYQGSYYGDLGLSRSDAVSKNSELDTSVTLGWANKAFNRTQLGTAPPNDYGGVTQVTGQVSLTINKGKFYLRPHIGVSSLLDKKLRDTAHAVGFNPTIVFGGLAVGTSF